MTMNCKHLHFIERREKSSKNKNDHFRWENDLKKKISFDHSVAGHKYVFLNYEQRNFIEVLEKKVH